MLGQHPARCSGPAEHRDGVRRSDEHDVIDPVQEARRLLRKIPEPLDARRARAALHACGERLHEHPTAGSLRDARHVLQGAAAACRTAEVQGAGLAPPQNAHGRRDARRVGRRCSRRRGCGSGGRARQALKIRRNDERRHLARRRRGGRQRARDVRADGLHVRARLDPPHRCSECGDVARERRIAGAVPRRVIADHVHHGCVRTPGVVEIGEAVRQPRPQMQERHRGAPGHAAEPVGGARTDALEEAEHRTNAADGIQRRDERHLRRARVREADVDAGVAGGGQNRLGAVHRPPSSAALAMISRASAVSARRRRPKTCRRSVPGSMCCATNAPSATHRTNGANSPANRSASFAIERRRATRTTASESARGRARVRGG